MNRLALLLAASVLGTGCIVSNDCTTREVDVVWANSFDDSGATGRGCASAGVTRVDVFVNDSPQPVASVPCTDGGATLSFASGGNYQLTTEGVDGAGVIQYRDDRTISSSTCGIQQVDVRPSAGTVNLNYAFNSGTSCFSANSYMWFGVFDTIARTVAAKVDETSAIPTQFACGPDVAFSIPSGALQVPSGWYRLDFMQEVEHTASVQTPFVERARSCTVPVFNIAPQQTTTVDVTLYDTGTVCP